MFSDKFIPSDFYGGEHLLRLFGTYLKLIFQTNWKFVDRDKDKIMITQGGNFRLKIH